MPGYAASAVDGSPKPGLTCLHCKLLLREPVQTEEGYRLCRGCFKAIQSLPDATCKECQVTASESCYPDKAVQREVLMLQVHCRHTQHGCSWVGTLKEWQGHCDGCSFQGSPCPNEGCQETLPRHALQAHLGVCPFRLTSCPHCLVKKPYSQLEAHYLVCEEMQITCEELFCNQTFMRKNMFEHKMKHCKIETCLSCQAKVLRDTGEELLNSAATASCRGAQATPPPIRAESAPYMWSKATPHHGGHTSSPLPILFPSTPGVQDHTHHPVHLSDPYENFRHHQDLAVSVEELKRGVASTQESQKAVSEEWVESKKIISDLKSENVELKSELAGLKQTVSFMESKIQDQEAKPAIPVSSSHGNKPIPDHHHHHTSVSSGYASSSSSVERKGAGPDSSTDIQRMHKDLEALQKVVEDIKSKAENGLRMVGSSGRGDVERDSVRGRAGHSSASDTRLLLAIEKRVEEVARQLTQVKVHGQELELQLQASLASTHNGSFLWRIPEVARRRRDAIDERVTSIYSPPFYTGRNGYKMCIRAYLNGDGMGYKTHLSLFFVLMRGECDPLLKWPFEYKVSMILVDQTHRKHIVQTFKPTPESSSFQQPQTDMNVASGCPQFAKLNVFDEDCYMKNDVMFVKCIVDTTKIFHP